MLQNYSKLITYICQTDYKMITIELLQNYYICIFPLKCLHNSKFNTNFAAKYSDYGKENSHSGR